MVDNFISGIYTNISRINPDTISAEAKLFLKNFREEIKLRRSIDKSLGNLIAKTLIGYHNDKGESIIPLVVELTTVAYFAIGSYREFALDVTEFIIMGTIFGVLTITTDEKEITDVIEQLMVGILTNPIFEFDPGERKKIASLVYQVDAYLGTLNFFSGRFTHYHPLIRAALLSGLSQALEICNATAEEINAGQDQRKYFLDRMLGRFKFYVYLFWPMFNITSNTMIKWLNKKTGIEIWPI
jgi:hypothetical protein